MLAVNCACTEAAKNTVMTESLKTQPRSNNGFKCSCPQTLDRSIRFISYLQTVISPKKSLIVPANLMQSLAILSDIFARYSAQTPDSFTREKCKRFHKPRLSHRTFS